MIILLTQPNYINININNNNNNNNNNIIYTQYILKESILIKVKKAHISVNMINDPQNNVECGGLLGNV